MGEVTKRIRCAAAACKRIIHLETPPFTITHDTRGNWTADHAVICHTCGAEFWIIDSVIEWVTNEHREAARLQSDSLTTRDQ